MTNLRERIEEIEREIRETPYNKATEHHIGRLKAKLARLKEELRARKRGPGRRPGFAIRKSGDASVALVGLPNVGKSTLLNVLTGARSQVADYDFTTLKVIPGMMQHKGAKIQVLDMPGLIQGASIGRGRGREILSAVRAVDLIMLLVDSTRPEQLEVMRTELEAAGVRLDQVPPDVILEKRERGGLHVKPTVELTHLNLGTIRPVLEEYGVVNAEITIKEDITLGRLIDFLSRSRAYLPSLVVLNKVDLLEGSPKEVLRGMERWGPIVISARKGTGLDALREVIYRKLSLIRVYLKPRGGKVDYREPMVMRVGSTVEDLCRKLHGDFLKRFKYGLLWGKGAKFPGQRVGLDHELRDGDVISISLGR
ncbi:MAG: GTP-binding protein [Candidatus Hadarchaeota archaeon]|nr:GTP-binding protein [Candidatus Hadarchaeota archaeon]